MSEPAGKILLGVTGSIAAFKAATLAGDLVSQGYEVRSILTPAAIRFVTPLTFAALTGRPPATDVDEDLSSAISHLDLARWGDILVVVPASADTIARMALGLADSLLSATALAFRGPILIAPAMETAMYLHPATQAHLDTLRSRGVTVLGPESGRLASGAHGEGRMVEPDRVAEAVRARLRPNRDLAGRRVLVTAGPTREAIDPIRYIGNRSSGRMGYAIAGTAAARGATVTLISGPTNLPTPLGVDRLDVESTEDMQREVFARAGDADVVIMAAAVADFRPERPSAQKLKRGATSLDLVPTPDISARTADIAPNAFRIGFALETEDLLERAREKLQRKHLDMIVANQVTASHNPLGSPTNRVTILTPEGEIALPEMPKKEVAVALWDRVAPLLAR